MKQVAIAAVQMMSELGDVEVNANAMRGWISRAAEEGASFVFFPECSLSGYRMDGSVEVALVTTDERMLALETFAFNMGIAIGYGFFERVCSETRPYITYVVAHGDERLVYRKTHLGKKERDLYAEGDDLPVAQVKGVNVGVQLCWEGHIPDIAATLRARDAQLLVAPHAGGLGGVRRLEAWNRYLPARALDNGMFVVACNALKGGIRSESTTCVEPTARGGGLAAYGPDGALLCSYTGADEHMMLANIGGLLPREKAPKGMRGISYFDRRRPKLYASATIDALAL